MLCSQDRTIGGLKDFKPSSDLIFHLPVVFANVSHRFVAKASFGRSRNDTPRFATASVPCGCSARYAHVPVPLPCGHSQRYACVPGASSPGPGHGCGHSHRYARVPGASSSGPSVGAAVRTRSRDSGARASSLVRRRPTCGVETSPARLPCWQHWGSWFCRTSSSLVSLEFIPASGCCKAISCFARYTHRRAAWVDGGTRRKSDV